MADMVTIVAAAKFCSDWDIFLVYGQWALFMSWDRDQEILSSLSKKDPNWPQTGNILLISGYNVGLALFLSLYSFSCETWPSFRIKILGRVPTHCLEASGISSIACSAFF